MNEGVLKQVAALPSKSPDELREMWQELFGTKAPPYNKSFLARRLSYRLQELACGFRRSRPCIPIGCRPPVPI